MNAGLSGWTDDDGWWQIPAPFPLLPPSPASQGNGCLLVAVVVVMLELLVVLVVLVVLLLLLLLLLRVAAGYLLQVRLCTLPAQVLWFVGGWSGVVAVVMVVMVVMVMVMVVVVVVGDGEKRADGMRLMARLGPSK